MNPLKSSWAKHALFLQMPDQMPFKSKDPEESIFTASCTVFPKTSCPALNASWAACRFGLLMASRISSSFDSLSPRLAESIH